MTEYMHLIGAEDVRRAGNLMQSAASDMQRAANQISESLHMHQQFMNDWLNRLETILNER